MSWPDGLPRHLSAAKAAGAEAVRTRLDVLNSTRFSRFFFPGLVFFCNNVFPDSSVFPARTSDFHNGYFAMGPRCFLQQRCFFVVAAVPRYFLQHFLQRFWLVFFCNGLLVAVVVAVVAAAAVAAAGVVVSRIQHLAGSRSQAVGGRSDVVGRR